jgi:hypothetical protein
MKFTQNIHVSSMVEATAIIARRLSHRVRVG